MTSDRWRILFEWLGDWIAADTNRREHLRARLAADHPDLVEEADALARASGGLRGFLETPALVLEAADIVSDDRVLPADTEIGHYRITSLIARGGSGDVYRATDLRLHRAVALKVLAPSRTADPRHVDRFVREARVTASFDHPHVVRIYDVGHDDGQTYLATELLEGETLRARIARGAIPLDEAVRIGLEVASGLDAAHTAGLVHRDLKPDNVFLTSAGAKILDFGIAKLAPDHTGHDEYLTLTGVVLGTSGYLAPEQILGSQVDRRADLFALGILLFEMLTGARAFERGHLVETLHAILHDPPSDVLRTRDDVPPEALAVVMRLLEKAPDARFQSAQDAIAALQRATGVETRESGNASLRVRNRSRVRPMPLLALALSLAAGLTAVSWLRATALPGQSADAPSPAPNEAALEKGRLGWVATRRPTPDDLQKAVKYFEEAIAIDPGYADAWAGLSSAYKRMPMLSALLPEVAFEKARAAARHALNIDPANVEAISTMGTLAFWSDWQYDRAETLLKQALTLQPGHADSHLFLAHLYSNTGRSQEALKAIRRAQSLDQQWPQARAMEGQFLYTARKYEDALRYLDAVVGDIDPGMWTSHMYRGDALFALGRPESALVAYDHALKLNRHPLLVALRGVLFAHTNRRGDAEGVLVQLPPDFPYGRAAVLHALGRDDEAIAALNAAVDSRHPLVTFLGVDRHWDDLRDRESFRAVMRRVNLLGVSDRFRR
jgi:serine/threonine-protein kinase